MIEFLMYVFMIEKILGLIVFLGGMGYIIHILLKDRKRKLTPRAPKATVVHSRNYMGLSDEALASARKTLDEFNRTPPRP